MADPLFADRASRLFEDLKPRAKDILIAFNDYRFLQAQRDIGEAHSRIAAARDLAADAVDAYFDDLYVLDRYFDFASVRFGLGEGCSSAVLRFVDHIAGRAEPPACYQEILQR